MKPVNTYYILVSLLVKSKHTNGHFEILKQIKVYGKTRSEAIVDATWKTSQEVLKTCPQAIIGQVTIKRVEVEKI